MSTEILTPDEHQESIELDLISREFSRTSTNPSLAIASLREFNSQLLARIGQFRKRNLELTASETSLREAVSELQAKCANFERTLEQKERELERAQTLHHTAVEALEKANRAHRDELQALENTKSELLERIETLNSQLNDSKSKIEQLQQREEQALEAFEKIRIEYSNMDKCYQEATERAAQLSAQLSESKAAFEKVLVETTARLQADFQKQFSALLAENQRLQERLDARDNRIETELARLKSRQDQVGFLEQHLNQLAVAIKKDKADILRIAKILSNDTGRPNPFKEETEAARAELANLIKRLSSSPQI